MDHVALAEFEVFFFRVYTARNCILYWINEISKKEKTG